LAPPPKLLIPVKKYKPLPGSFTWPARPVLASVRGADVLPLGQLAADLRNISARRARIVRDAVSPADVRIRRDAKIAQPEAYKLTVTPEGVEVRARGDAGAYYAIQTLRELVQIGGKKLRACVIDDWPDFARRAVYEDCSRGKVPTLDTVKALIERLAHWKINEFQLYVENVFTFRRHPEIGRGYSPFTPADILEIQDFCKQHHVRLVGSLTSFGHMDKILKLPGYIHLAELPGHRGLKGGTTLCPSDPGSIKLVAEMYEEFVPLFEAVDFNSCCDETWELGKGRSKRRADRIGVGRVYLEFVLKVHKLCCKHGKRMNIWADIILKYPRLLRQIPEEIVMLNWEYSPAGRRIACTAQIAAAGRPLMVCPGTSSWQTHNARLNVSIPNIANFVATGRRCGAEGVLNTDWGDCGHRNLLGTSLHGFAHGAAHSWHGRAVNDSTFTRLFCRRVFAQDDDRLARALLAAGRAYQDAKNRFAGSALYHALVEGLKRPGNRRPAVIDRLDRPGLAKVIARLSDPNIWPEPAKALPSFERLAMQEFVLAARMDCLAARRGLAGLRLRAGQAVSAAELRGQAAEMRRIAAQFSRLWLARNRPSRLADNLRAFTRVEKEARRLAKR